MMGDIEVRRFAIKYEPPTLCVEYKIDGERTVLRKISFKKYRGTKTPDEIADKVLRKCEDILGPEHARRVSEDQVRDLVTLLLTPHDQHSPVPAQGKRAASASRGAASREYEDEYEGDDDDNRQGSGSGSGSSPEKFGDLNAVTEEENARAKQVMSARFEENRVRPGDAAYVYDRRVDFEGPTEVADWDKEDEDEDEE